MRRYRRFVSESMIERAESSMPTAVESSTQLSTHHPARFAVPLFQLTCSIRPSPRRASAPCLHRWYQCRFDPTPPRRRRTPNMSRSRIDRGFLGSSDSSHESNDSGRLVLVGQVAHFSLPVMPHRIPLQRLTLALILLPDPAVPREAFSARFREFLIISLRVFFSSDP
jgi:hypothetical protein